VPKEAVVLCEDKSVFRTTTRVKVPEKRRS